MAELSLTFVLGEVLVSTAEKLLADLETELEPEDEVVGSGVQSTDWGTTVVCPSAAAWAVGASTCVAKTNVRKEHQGAAVKIYIQSYPRLRGHPAPLS